MDVIVSDTGPLISLEKLSDSYEWMQQLYGQILIPDAVAQELYQGMFSTGLKFSGLAGQILKAYRGQIISLAVAQANLTDLLKAGRMGKRLYAELLEALER